jgi:hypothetical protein
MERVERRQADEVLLAAGREVMPAVMASVYGNGILKA